ncbi:MAG: hypothetical protein CL712_00375 [Chloroflexi bacterium]|nr:hypothetical protein [Chloroflexota bacterium]
MFKLEKVLQNDDSAYIYFTFIIKSLVVYLSYYIFSILEENSIYELKDSKIFINSKYYIFSLLLSTSYLILSLFLKKRKTYQNNFISYLRQDVGGIIICKIFIFAIYFIKNENFEVNINYVYSVIFLLFNMLIFKLIFNYLYNYMVHNDVIQKNIMLVGSFKDIKSFFKQKKNQTNIYKCCIVDDYDKIPQKLLKNEIKVPIFKKTEDIRSILEYHELGQIWILKSKNTKSDDLIQNIIKYSVDILIVDLETTSNLNSQELLNGKFEFKKYEISRFHGMNLLIKITLDKILAITFLIIASPILLISIIFILVEDGYPILFTQNRTGWDGRRFKIFKLRTLKKGSFDKTVQVTLDDKRKLKCGTFIRQFSIDEVPQLFNVLFGDMSIVGPRPHMVEHDIKYSKLFNTFLKRHKCSPGLTGWAQVNGLRGATPNPENMKKRMEHDLWYLNNWTIFLDLYIILKTFYVIFKYKGD